MPLPPQRILLAEDSEDDVVLLKHAFKRAEIDIPLYWACDGQQTIDYLAGTKPFEDRTRHPLPDLILLDIKMPYKTGLEVLNWIRNHDTLQTLPVIMLTSSNDPGDRERARELGATSYLVKPSSIEALIEMAKELRERWLS